MVHPFQVNSDCLVDENDYHARTSLSGQVPRARQQIQTEGREVLYKENVLSISCDDEGIRALSERELILDTLDGFYKSGFLVSDWALSQSLRSYNAL